MPDGLDPKIQLLADALSSQESGGDYSVVNKRTGAIGKWQVLPSNIPAWSKEILGFQITPAQFKNNPRWQNEIVTGKLGKEVERNTAISDTPLEALQRTSLWWYSGTNDPTKSKFWDRSPAKGEPSGRQYVSQVTKRLTGTPPPVAPGQVIPGNIDLNKRPIVKNPDGSVSTVRSISINADGREYLIPTVTDDGRVVSNDEAIDLFKKTGKHLGAFSSVDAANRYAQTLHQQQEQLYVPRRTITAPGSYDPSELPYPQPVNPAQVNANVEYLNARPAPQPVQEEAPQVPEPVQYAPPVVKQPFIAPRYPLPPAQGGTSNIQAPNIPQQESLSGLPAAPAPVIREGDYAGSTALPPIPQKPQASVAPVADATAVAPNPQFKQIPEQTIGPTGGAIQDQYRAEYRNQGVAKSGMTEDAYVGHRTRQDAVALLQKSGTEGKILSAIIGEAPSDPASDFLKKFSLNAANSLAAGALEAANPKAYSQANKALDLGDAGNLIAEHGGGLAGTLTGVGGAKLLLEKAAAPLMKKLAAPVIEGLAGAIWQAPSEAVQVAEGKPIGEALKSTAITAAQFGLIGPASKFAEDVAKTAAPLGGAEAAVWNTVGNAALQTGIMAGGEYANTGNVSPETILTGLALSAPQVREANKRFKSGPEIDVARLAEKYPMPEPKIKTIDELTSGIGQEFVVKPPEGFAEPSPPKYKSLIPEGEPNATTTGQEPNSNSIEHPRVDENLSSIGQDRQYTAEEQRTRLENITGNSRTGSGSQTEKPLSGRAQKRAEKDFIANFNPSNVEDAALHFIAEGGKFNLPEIKKLILGSNLKVGGRKSPKTGRTPDIPSSFLNVADNKGITIDRFITDYLPDKLGVTELSAKEQYDAATDIQNAIGKLKKRGDAVELLKKRGGQGDVADLEAMRKAYGEGEAPSNITPDLAEAQPVAEAAFYGGKDQESLFGNNEIRGKSLLEKDLDERISLAEKSVRESRKLYEQKKKEAASAILGGASEKYANEALRKYEDSAKAAENILFDLTTTRNDRIQKIRSSEQSLFDEGANFGGEETPAQPTLGLEPEVKQTRQFAENDRAYTYEVSPHGTPVGAPITGRIVTKEVALRSPSGAFARDEQGQIVKQTQQFIKPRSGKLIPVNEHTALFGEAHPLTQQMRGENAPSTFIVGKIADEIARSITGDKADVSLSGRGSLGSMQIDKERSKLGIGLRYENFADPNLASGVIAHEIGHIVDLAGEHVTMERGNILGHVLALRQNAEAVIGDLSNKTLRKELINLAAEWHPFEKTTERYIQARTTSKELAADAIGAMLNNSELVRRVAPTFAASFDEMIAARPQAKAAFDLLSGALHGDEKAIGELYSASIREGFSEAELHRSLNAEAEQIELEARKPSAKQRLLSAFNTFAPADALAMKALREGNKILKEVKLTAKAQQDYARLTDVDAKSDYLAQFNQSQQTAILKANAIMGGQLDWPRLLSLTQQFRTTADQQNAMVHDWQGRIFEPLKEAGVALEDFGEYLTATAILGNYRAGIANPFLGDRIAAQSLLTKLQQDLGIQNYKLVENAAKSLREQSVSLAEDMHASGMISDAMMATIHNNSDSYARFASAMKANESVRFTREEARGTAGAIQNPALSITLQLLDMRRKLNYQLLTRELVTQIRNLEGEGSAVVVEPFGKQPKGSKTIAYYENGKRVEVAVDPWFADMYNYVPDVFQGRFANAVDFIKSLQRGILIQYNPTFQLKNIPRDIMQTVENVGLGVMKEYYSSAKSAGKAQRGKLEGSARDAYTQGVVREFNVSSRYEQPVNAADKLFQATGVREPEQSPALARANKILGKVALSPVWETLEATPHLATREFLLKKGYSQLEADYVGGVLSGTPDTRIRGSFWTKAASFPFMFANVQLQGNARALRLARNPRTRSAFLMRALVLNAPQIALVGLASGAATKAAQTVFGDDSDQAQLLQDIENKYKYIPQYFLKNYFSVPVEWSERNGKRTVKTVTFPMEETGATAFNAVYPVIKLASDRTTNFGDFIQEASNGIGNALPSYSPYVQVASLWSDYLISGHNPYDNFYGNNILSDQEYKIAQGDKFNATPLKKMAEYSMRSLFGTSYRMIESWVSPERPFEFMGYYRETRGGAEEKYRTAQVKQQAATASEQLFRSAIVKQGPDAIQQAYDLDQIDEKQYKRMMRKAENPAQALSRISVEDLQQLREQLQFDVTATDKIDAELERRGQ